MVDAKQLRKGNLIYGVSDRIEEVVEIKKDTLVTKHFHPDFNDDFECENEYFSFIPLSRRLALQLGFKELPHFAIGQPLVFDLGRNRHLSIGSISSPNLTVYLCETVIKSNDISDLICIHNWDYDKELYVHKLQNIVYDLSGKELTYNWNI